MAKPQIESFEKKKTKNFRFANLFAKSDRIMLKSCKRANLKLKRSSPCLSSKIKYTSFIVLMKNVPLAAK